MSRPPRSQLVAYAVIAIAVLVLGGRWLAAGGGAAPAPELPVSTAPSPEGAPAVEQPSRAAVVHVAGAVRRPGVYKLAAGARVQDAVRRAGGATGKGDVNAINLAAPVQDGAQVVVPLRAAAAAVPAS
ncbi:MAG: ComEA family DNA-binding protein, partial [Solirubrobacterales bacterium]|nr:ComEA family DNA-binding protein [Solirubrobacterales bacterium]